MNVNQVIKSQTKPLETCSSILSDYEDVDVTLVDGESYVLFNPIKAQESDILSLTNTQDTEDGLVDLVDPGQPQVTPRRAQQPLETLLNKINKWYSATNEYDIGEVDDNVALWNLDENLRTSLGPVVREFYGDDMFKYMARDDFDKVKRVTREAEVWLRREARLWLSQWSAVGAAALAVKLLTETLSGFGPVVSRSSSVSVTS